MQVKVWGKTWGNLAALVVLAHILVVLYMFLGTRRGGASMTGLLTARAVSAQDLTSSVRSGLNASTWDPQVHCMHTFLHTVIKSQKPFVGLHLSELPRLSALLLLLCGQVHPVAAFVMTLVQCMASLGPRMQWASFLNTATSSTILMETMLRRPYCSLGGAPK